jgi:hypothetical protein
MPSGGQLWRAVDNSRCRSCGLARYVHGHGSWVRWPQCRWPHATREVPEEMARVGDGGLLPWPCRAAWRVERGVGRGVVGRPVTKSAQAHGPYPGYLLSISTRVGLIERQRCG